MPDEQELEWYLEMLWEQHEMDVVDDVDRQESRAADPRFFHFSNLYRIHYRWNA